MKFLWLFLLVFTVSILSSCGIDGSFRGLYSYYKVTQKEDPNFIQRPDSNLCNITSSNSNIVYKINGKELKVCLKTESRTMVYIWSPNCSASVCVPPNYAQEYANNNNLELFIVANYYHYNKMTENFELVRPLFGVDTEHYRSNLTDRYMKKFKEDLIGREWVEDYYPRFLLFHNDSLISSSNNIETLEIQ